MQFEELLYLKLFCKKKSKILKIFVEQPAQQAWVQMDIALSYKSSVEKGIYEIILNTSLCNSNSHNSENKEFWKAPFSLQFRKLLWNEI